MYKLHISSRAEKQIKKIKRSHQSAILSALEELREDPLIGKPLSRELSGRFTYRISVYRIIYKVNQKDKIVEILSTSHRTKVYD